MVSCKGIDPLGHLSRTGDLATVGAIIFHDTELKSQQNIPLNEENVKSLVDTNEPASIPARYHMAVLPAHVPRMASVNFGLGSDGQVDPGYWFEINGCIGLATLARKQYGMIPRLSDGQLAVMRRVVIFFVSREEIGLQVAMLNTELESDLFNELETERLYNEAHPHA